MANKIQLRRGLKSKLPTLSSGEPAYATDSREFYIGTGSGNVNIGGSMWYKGTDMSGTVTTTGYYSYSACPQVKVGDTYLNTSNGNIYECTTAGSGSTAKWTYRGSIRGATGQRGSKWYTGTAMSGTSTTTGAYTWDDGEQKYVGDMYLNTSYGYVYKCTTAGTGTNAKWTYQGTIKGEDGKDAATYIVTTQGELDTALSNVSEYTPTKIVLKYSTLSSTDPNFSIYTSKIPNYCKIHFEALDKYVNTNNSHLPVRLIFDREPTGVKLSFSYCGVEITCNPSQIGYTGAGNTSLTFSDCFIRDDNHSNISELYNGKGDLRFINCDTSFRVLADESSADFACLSGIITTGDVDFIGGSVTVEAPFYSSEDYDTNLIYRCTNLSMLGVTIMTTGNSAGRINLIRNCNKPTVNGCHIYLNGAMHSIGHIADTDRTVGGSFTGNYVEYYKTYMRFATISGNTFNHLAAGSSSANQIVLQCPTNMSGNTFKGSAAYVDAQSEKVIVDRNLHDNGLTVAYTASGSITSNNLQY